MTLLRDADRALGANEYSKALEMYQLLLKDDPNNPKIYQGMAYSLYELKQFDDALKKCKRALELDLNLSLVHVVLAYIHLRRKELEISKQEALEAFKLDPDLFDVLRCYGTVLLVSKDVDKAVELLQKAVEMKPDDLISHSNLALAYLRKQQFALYFRERKIISKLQPSLTSFGELLLAYLIRYKTFISLLLVILFMISVWFQLKYLLIIPVAGVTLVLILSLFLLHQKQWKRGVVLILYSVGTYFLIYVVYMYKLLGK